MALGGFELFRLFGSIGLKGADGVDKQLDGIDKKTGGLAKTMKKVGKGALVAGAAAATFAVVVGTKAVKAAESWETGLANIDTLLGGKDPLRLGVISDAMKKLSIETGLSAESVQEGAYQVISAFGDTEDTADLLEVVSKAAVAGNVSVADSLNLVSGITKGYGDTSVEAAEKASDLAFLTVKLGQTTFPELASSMGKVVPLADALSVSQEELFGVMSTLTGVTGNTAEVSTQFRGVLQGLMKPSKEMTAALDKMGFETGEAAIDSLGLQGVLKGLSDTVDGDTIKLAGMWGSIEGGTAVMALTGSQAENFTEKTLAMSEASGEASNAYEVQSKTFANSMARMKQKLNVALVDIGTKLLPIVEELMDAFMELVPPLMEFIKPLIDKLMPVVKTIIDRLFPVFLELLDAFMPILDPLIDIFLFLVDSVLIPLIDVLVPIIKQIMPVFVKLLDMLIPILEPLVKLFFQLVEAILPPLMDLVLKLVEAFMPLIEAILPIIIELLEIMMPIWLLWIDALLWLVDTILPVFIAGLTFLAEKVFPKILEALRKIKPAINKVVKWFRELPAKIPAIIEELKNKIVAVWEKIKWATKKAFLQLKGTIFMAWWNIRKTVGEAVTKLIDKVKEIPKKIKDKFSDFKTRLKAAGSNLITGLWNGISSKVRWITNKIKGFSSSVIKKIKSIFGVRSPSTVMAGIGVNLDEGLAKGIIKSIDVVKKAAGKMGGIAIDAVANPINMGAVNSPLANTPMIAGMGNGSQGLIVNFYDTKVFDTNDIRKLSNSVYQYWQSMGVGKAR